MPTRSASPEPHARVVALGAENVEPWAVAVVTLVERPLPRGAPSTPEAGASTGPG
ncbi:hypothetical protein GCM10022204_01820 [Microlunatus aurantiacus]|uniref:Uncharacterized protein n=1 Tax=Microlunatus aurantiacus TaxID=446786 RepID=A0ABP7CLE3_9ACTN